MKYYSKAIIAYVRSYKILEFYWILGARHMVIMCQSYILGGKNEANGNNLLMHVFIFPLSIGAG
jgi:hypothetical protein